MNKRKKANGSCGSAPKRSDALVKAIPAILACALAVVTFGCGCSRKSDSSAKTQSAKEKTATISIPAPAIPDDAPVLSEVYPSLSNGALRLARLTRLPPGILLHAEGLKITTKEMEAYLSQVPPAMREQMRRNAFFMLEQKATGKLLLTKARQVMPGAGMGDEALIRRYLDSVAAKAIVAEEEVVAFFEANRERAEDFSYEQIRNSIYSHLLRQRQQAIIDRHNRELGRDLPIAISDPWVAQESVQTLANPLDQARASGKPTFASFGADTCIPCQKMAPFRKLIAEEYGDRLNVVYVQVNKDEILAARYGIQGIPHVAFFDAAGLEIYNHPSFMPLETIRSWIAKLNVQPIPAQKTDTEKANES